MQDFNTDNQNANTTQQDHLSDFDNEVISDLLGGGTDDASNTANNVEEENNPQPDTQQDVPNDAGNSQGSNQDASGQPRTTEQGQNNQSTSTRAGEDGRGNLIDPNTGQIIARSGKQRREYQDEAIYNYHKVKQHNEQLTTRLKEFESIDATQKEYGLSAPQVVNSLQFGALYYKDPNKALELLLTDAKKRGINLEGFGSNIDSNAIKQLIAEELQPIREQRQQTEQQAEYYRKAGDIIAQFYTVNPEAQIHEDLLNIALQSNPNWDLNKAWIEVIKYASENGYSLQQPLNAQIQARRSATPTTPQNGTKPAQAQRPLPNGRSVSSSQVGENKPIVARESDQWDTIVNNVWNEVGL